MHIDQIGKDNVKNKEKTYTSVIHLILLLCIQLPSYLCGMQPPQQFSTLKIQGSDGKIEIPLDIAQTSKTINHMLGDLGGNRPELIIPIELYSSGIIQESFSIVAFLSPPELNLTKPKEDPLKTELSLERRILILNCLEFLDFPENIKTQLEKKIYPKVYLECKKIPFKELISQVQDLYSTITPGLFGNRIVNRLKFLLITNSITQKDREINTQIGYSNTSALSPNNKIVAGTDPGGSFFIEIINNGQVIKRKEITTKSINKYKALTFIDDNTLAIMIEKDIFIYRIKTEEEINLELLQKFDLSNYIPHVECKIQISPNKKLFIVSNGNNCFLWHINEDATIKSDSYHLIKDKSFELSIGLYEDAIVIISTEDRFKRSLQVFNTDGTLNFSFELPVGTSPVGFYSHDKKFIAQIQNEIFMYDFNDKDKIRSKKVYSSDVYLSFLNVILDDSAIFMGSGKKPNNMLFLDMNSTKNDPKKITIGWNSTRNIFISSDSSIMAFGKFRRADLMYMLISNEEKSILEEVKKLGVDKLLLIDKLIDGVQGLPQLEASPDIMGLLIDLDLIKAHAKNPAKAAALLKLSEKKIPNPDDHKNKNPLSDPDQKNSFDHSDQELPGQIKDPVQAAALLNLRKDETNEGQNTTEITSTLPRQPQPSPKPEENLQPATESIVQDSGIPSAVKTFFSGIKYFFNLFVSIITGRTTGLPG